MVLSAPAEIAAQDESPNLKIGLGGVAKLGHWAPVQFNVAPESSAASATGFRITVVDGEDTPVMTAGPVIKNQNGFQGLVQLGRTYGDGSFELLDVDEVLLSYKTTIGLGGDPIVDLLPSTATVYACLEPGSESKPAEESFADTFSNAFPDGVKEDDRVVAIHDPGELPSLAIAWEGCEALAILVNDKQWLGRFNEDSLNAIDAYVRGGGLLILAVSPQCEWLLQDGGSLQRFVDGSVGDSIELSSSRRLAEFCNSNEPFLNRDETMTVLDLKNVNGRVVLQQGEQALAIRSSHGVGEVALIAFDPTGKQFRDWKAGKPFMQSLMKQRFGNEDAPATSGVRSGTSVRHSGYTDLVGQMKVPLERFNDLRFIRFELIALLIVLYIVCIGVGDWFLVGKVFKKYELTWITFPLLAALFCGIAWFAAAGSRPATIKVNQIELIDIDSVSGDARATVWGNIYSPRGKTVDLRLGVNGNAVDRGLSLDGSQLTWLGLPGDGLGGMLNRANPGLIRTGYLQHVIPIDGKADANIDMHSVELQVSSTRPLLGKWQGKFEKSVASRLRSENGRLEGTFINPLDVPLKNCAIFFNDRVYLIEGTFPVDDDVDIQSGTTEKTIRSYLTRRTSGGADDKSKSQSVAWDPKSVDLTRIMQMMMFFHGSGGESYTGLSNSFQDFVEMTPQSSLNRAILVGRISDRVSSIEFDRKNADDLYDSSLSFVRVLMPVEPNTESRKRQGKRK